MTRLASSFRSRANHSFSSASAFWEPDDADDAPFDAERRHWAIDDLDFCQIDVRRAHADDNLFYLAASASFVESGSDLYSRNLIGFFEGDDEVAGWLQNRWEPEELQHGRALRAYVNHIWPEFDWQSAYRSFLDEYRNYCKVELLEPTRTLELAARCVVETGTATYYTALSRGVDEPFLRALAALISADEVRHYKHFYRAFKRYQAQEMPARRRVFATIARRTLELKSEDGDCAVRHVINVRSPERAGDARFERETLGRISTTVRKNLKAATTLKMLMRPLGLSPRMQSVVQFPVERFMNSVFLR